MQIGNGFSSSMWGSPALAPPGRAADRPDPSSVNGIAADFEGLFVSILLKQMRASLNEEGLFAGENSDTLGGLFDLYLGKHIAQSGGFGLARVVESYLASQQTK